MLLYATEGKYSFRPGNLSSSQLEAHFDEVDFGFVFLLFAVGLCVEAPLCVCAAAVECEDAVFFFDVFERA